MPFLYSSPTRKPTSGEYTVIAVLFSFACLVAGSIAVYFAMKSGAKSAKESAELLRIGIALLAIGVATLIGLVAVKKFFAG